MKKGSAKQLACRARFKAQGTKIPAAVRAKLGLPHTSWWVGLTAEQMISRAPAEQSRMRCSKIGQVSATKYLE